MPHNKIIGAIGPKGSGKTHQVVRYLAAQERFAAFVIFRNDVEYLSVCEQRIIENPRELARGMCGDRFKIVYHPAVPEVVDGEFQFPFFDKFLELCMARGNMLACFDEAHLLCDAKNAPPWLLMSLIDGRRQGLDLLYVSHRFSTVHRMLTANTDEFWFWKITEPADVGSIRDRCGRDVADRVQACKRLENKPTGLVPGDMIRWTTYEGIADDRRTSETEDEVPDVPERHAPGGMGRPNGGEVPGV